jgi:hypothetical protein
MTGYGKLRKFFHILSVVYSKLYNPYGLFGGL